MNATTWLVEMCDDNKDLNQLLLRALRGQCKELAIAIMNVIQRPVWQEIPAKFEDLAMDIFESETVSFLEWQRAWQRNCNNYRKLKHMPLIRRLRCRWRARESRRRLDKLSVVEEE